MFTAKEARLTAIAKNISPIFINFVEARLMLIIKTAAEQGMFEVNINFPYDFAEDEFKYMIEFLQFNGYFVKRFKRGTTNSTLQIKW